nr:uncharacterized protein LOC129257675 [Lytechinus pictus]
MERTGERVTYKCRLCRQQLFDSSCVLNTSTNHHQDVVSSECSLGQSAMTAASPTWTLASSMQGSAKSFALLTQGRTGGSSDGVLAPYGQVTAGPNPLWYINEESTPPWVQRILNKFQWKKGKLSCPKCHGRLGAFDFVTPYKVTISSKKVSRIHVMRSRVDCESSSPIVARIRPMPQNPRDVHESNDLDEPTSTAQPEASVAGAENLPHPSDIYPPVPVTSAPVLPLLSEQTSRQFLPETFSSASDEESLSNLPIYQRPVSVSQPLEQTQRHNVISSTTSMPAEQSHQRSISTGNPRIVRSSSGSQQCSLSLQSGDLDTVRHRINRGTVQIDKCVPFGIEIGQARSDSEVTMKNSPKDRSVAHVAGTNRLKKRVAQQSFTSSLPSTSNDIFGPTINSNQRHNLQYDNHSDEPEDDDDHPEERVHYRINLSSPSSSSISTVVSHSRSPDISANIFKNSPAFLRPLISSTFSSDQTRSPTPGSSPPSLYSPVLPSAEQDDRTTPTARDGPFVSQGLTVRDSDDDEDTLVVDHQRESAPIGVGQRSPREQRRERNRKKKERRKQRRYERWLERQTLGAEEESAIQDISAAGLYSLLGPRCAGSSLREVTTCSVCLDIYYQPHTCFPCEHIFCEPCLRQVARFHPVVTPCPLCRTTIRNVKIHDQLTSAVKQLFPRQFDIRHHMERRTLNRSFPLPGNSNLPPWYRMGYQNNRNQVDFLASRRNPGYVHDWGMRYLQGVVWRVVASTAVLLIVSGISVGFLHFMFDFS